jgi:hypothetical protein
MSRDQGFKLIRLSEVERPARGTNAFVQDQSHDAVVVPLITRSGEMPAPAPHGWLKPGVALARVQDALGGDRTMAITTIIGRLKAKQLHAHFENYEWGGVAEPPKLGSNFIGPKLWDHYYASSDSAYVWVSSDLYLYLGNYFGRYSESSVTITFFRVTLDADGIGEIVANATPPAPRRSVWIKKPKDEPPAPTAEPAVQAKKGGAPRKEWWDDFWIEICRQIWMGDLTPKTQADLERAMLEWVENRRDATVGETTIKSAARKLFKAWNLGVKN